jgi:DNA polymerase-3 subunit gamma/tau
MRLAEKYRPKEWREVVGQDKAIATINRLREHGGLAGRAYFITGATGTGKTTIARLIAAEVCDSFGLTELDGSQVNAEILEEIAAARRHRPFGAGYCYIIDECHALRGATITRLLKLTEDLPEWLTVIFCTTSDAKESLFDENLDANPLLHRCEEIQLARRDLSKPFAELAAGIAAAEGLNGQPIAAYVKLAQECRNSLRAMLAAIEGGRMIAKGGA